MSIDASEVNRPQTRSIDDGQKTHWREALVSKPPYNWRSQDWIIFKKAEWYYAFHNAYGREEASRIARELGYTGPEIDAIRSLSKTRLASSSLDFINQVRKRCRVGDLAAEMVRRGLLLDNKADIDAIINQMMTWNDDAFNAMKRVVLRHPLFGYPNITSLDNQQVQQELQDAEHNYEQTLERNMGDNHTPKEMLDAEKRLVAAEQKWMDAFKTEMSGKTPTNTVHNDIILRWNNLSDELRASPEAILAWKAYSSTLDVNHLDHYMNAVKLNEAIPVADLNTKPTTQAPPASTINPFSFDEKVKAERSFTSLSTHVQLSREGQKAWAEYLISGDSRYLNDYVKSQVQPPSKAVYGEWVEPGKPEPRSISISDMDKARAYQQAMMGAKVAEQFLHTPNHHEKLVLPNDRQRLDKSINSIQELKSELDKKFADLSAQIQNADARSKIEPPKTANAGAFNEADIAALEQMLDAIEGGQVKTNPTQLNELHQLVDDVENKIRTIYEGGLPPETQHVEREPVMAKSKSGWVTEVDGTKKHYTKEGVLHMEGQPAEVRPNGTQLYYVNGALHRDGGQPAMQGARGTQKYAVNGKYHRLGGLPAITWSKGPYRFEYWVNGEIQRAQRKDGTQEWFAPGSTERDDAAYHRTDGPAVIHPNGAEEFWLNGAKYTQAGWLTALERLNANQEEALDQELIDEDPIEAVEELEEVVTTKTKTTKATKETKMEKPSFTEMFKANAVSAGYRVAGTQITNVVKGAFLTAMANRGTEGGTLQAIKGFLDSDLGEAFIAFAIGSGLIYLPGGIGDKPEVQRLAEEMRVNGMATTGNLIMGEAMQHLIPAVMQIVNTLPAVTPEKTNTVRVIEAADTSKLAAAMEEEENEEATEEVALAKTMKA